MATRSQRGNQNLYIEEKQTTQWPKDTKGVIRICISIYEFCVPLWYLLAIVSFIFFDIQILITALLSFDHCFVCSSSIYRFWLPFGIIRPLCRLLFFDIQILITPLVSCGHCVVSSYSLYGFWLPLWYLLAIVLSVLLRYTDSDYPFGIFWPLCCQFFFDIRILITRLVSFGHCVVSSSSIYGIWLPLWYLCGNQNLYIEEELTTQWTKDTKWVIRICISKKNWQHDGQKIPKG
jgi:hypothetical protein